MTSTSTVNNSPRPFKGLNAEVTSAPSNQSPLKPAGEMLQEVAKNLASGQPSKINQPEENVEEVKNPNSPASLSQLKLVTKDFENDSLTIKIINLFNGVDAFNLPKLEWKNEFHAGGTGYIDGIKPSDLSDSVMWGIDPAKRLYIAVKKVMVQPNGRFSQPGVETIFQRYSDSAYVWTSGKHFDPTPTLVISRLDEKIFPLFEKLVKGEEITLSAWDDPDTEIQVKLA